MTRHRRRHDRALLQLQVDVAARSPGSTTGGAIVEQGLRRGARPEGRQPADRAVLERPDAQAAASSASTSRRRWTRCSATSRSPRRRSTAPSRARRTRTRSSTAARRRRWPRPSPATRTRRSRPRPSSPKSRADGLKMILKMLYVLLGFSVIVSLFGMVNTLVLAVYERTRELGMLRAVGMTRRQARRMIRHESVITALIGAAMGIPLGVFLAALDHPGAVEVRRRAVAAGDRAGRVHRGGDRRRRARGDHPRPPRVAHQRARRPAVRVGRAGRAAMRRRPAVVRLRVGGAEREGQRLAVRAGAQRVVGVDQLAEPQRDRSLETGPL